MISPSGSNYSDRMGRVFLKALKEIIGIDGGNELINHAGLSGIASLSDNTSEGSKFTFEHISLIQGALSDDYGCQSGRGLALRIGRASLKYILGEFGADLGLTHPSFRLLPVPTRIKAGTEALVGLFNHLSDHPGSIELNEEQIIWHIKSCPLCRDRQSDDPCCTFEVGLLQEALNWGSGGKYYPVGEDKCMGCGDDECTIIVERNAVN
jgi:predicted hydrocarbon binding protein